MRGADLSSIVETTPSRPAYRMRRNERGRLHRVRFFRGVAVYEETITRVCSGCSDVGDYGTVYGPFGCAECGYTGYRRETHQIPFCNHWSCAKAVYGRGRPKRRSCTAAT